MKGHMEKDGFHPHNDNSGKINSNSIDSSTELSERDLSFMQRGSGKKKLKTQSRELPVSEAISAKKHSLQSALRDADRRYEIATSKISKITNRIHELEKRRNDVLRKEFLLNEIKKNPDNSKELIAEYNKIKSVDDDPLVYEEMIQGYKSLSRRKNELEEERNEYVKEIEALEKLSPQQLNE